MLTVCSPIIGLDRCHAIGAGVFASLRPDAVVHRAGCECADCKLKAETKAFKRRREYVR